MRKITFILLCFLLCNLQLNAQKRSSQTSEEKLVESYKLHAADVVGKFALRLDSIKLDSSAVASLSADTQLSPYLYKMIGPAVYYGSAVGKRIQLDWQSGAKQTSAVRSEGMTYRDQLAEVIDNALVTGYLAHPSDVKYYDLQIEREQVVKNAKVPRATTKDLDEILNSVDNATDVADVVGPMDIGLTIEKPNFWKTAGKFGLQFTQNYFSQNWYKGGNNNVTLLTSLLLEANYNDQRRLQWDNKLELKLGFVTVPSDTVHHFLTNNDKIHLQSKLGVKAFDKFYYTVQGEAQTQFMPGYKSNDTTAYSRFLAPLDVYLSLGMDFKPTFKNGSTMSVALLPLSYKLRYIHGGDEVIIKAYKMRDLKRQQNDFGSKLEFNCNMKILENFFWRSRFFYYTTYKYVEAEFENVFAFNFNKYITAEVYTLWRFDDNRDMKYWDETLGFFQFKEYLTLGLSYNF